MSPALCLSDRGWLLVARRDARREDGSPVRSGRTPCGNDQRKTKNENDAPVWVHILYDNSSLRTSSRASSILLREPPHARSKPQVVEVRTAHLAERGAACVSVAWALARGQAEGLQAQMRRAAAHSAAAAMGARNSCVFRPLHHSRSSRGALCANVRPCVHE